jgi:hypothetical protein
MFDVSTLQNLLNALKTKTGKVPGRINTLDAKIANNPQLKNLVKDVAKTAKAFFINLEEAQYTFTTGQDKNGNIRVYSPSVGNLGGVAVLSWGAFTIPVSALARDTQLSIAKDGLNFVLKASTVDGKKAIDGTIRLVLPKGSKITLPELQNALGDDETPSNLEAVLGNVIVDTIPNLALERYKGATLNISSWVETRDGEYGKKGFITFYELGDARISAPGKVVSCLPKENFEIPSVLHFDEGEFLLKIDGTAVVASSGNAYLVCTPIMTRGVDLSGFGADDDDTDAYGLPSVASTAPLADETDDADLEGWGSEDASPLADLTY